MKRRTFLQLGAAAAAGPLFATPKALGQSENLNAGAGMRISKELLDKRNQNRSTVVCSHGMVCSSHPLASMAGVDILKGGGTAVDAAICANSMLTLVEPMSCGPGGDLFAIVWSEQEQQLFGLNASGRAPHAWNLEAALALGLESLPPYSPLAWSVPGCVSGWEKLHQRMGRAGFDTLFAPVIEYAREGFPLSPLVASGWNIDPERFPTLAETFTRDGRNPQYGEMVTNPQLADFYTILLRDGLRAYYEGEIAERIVRFSQQNGGHFALRDFQEHSADWVDPVSTNYRGYDVWEIPPNGQGISVLQMLNLLEHFDLGSLAPNSPEHLHLFIEAKKLAYEDRAVYYADPKFADVPTEWLISKEYAAERVKRIDPRKAAIDVPPGQFRDASDTVYLCAADSAGNMVSLIQSIYHGWGSHIVPGKLGFPLQNRGMSFALDPQHRNRLEPGKRPFHTIIPAFMTEKGQPRMAFGVMGGDFQPLGHTQIVMNMIDFGMSPQQAGDQPRLEHVGSSTPTGRTMTRGGEVILEHGFTAEFRAQLEAMGHELRDNLGAFGGYQSIWRENGPLRYFGGSDPRKDGAAMGW